MKLVHLKIIATALIILFPTALTAQEDTHEKAVKLEKNGNYKEAYDLYQKLLTEQTSTKTANQLNRAQSCLRRLNRTSEIDTLIENTIEKHPKKPTLLIQAATIYSSLPHYGYIIAGEFKRGQHRGGGQYAASMKRDRTRTLQLLEQALQLSTDKAQLNHIYYSLSHALLMNSHNQGSWRLQTLTNLTQLPEIEPGNRWHRGGRNPAGAPVSTEGNPLFYQLPTSWPEAKNDGERLRLCLHHNNQQLRWAQFLHTQFGVTTMAHYSWFSSISMDEQKGILSLHSLKDSETVARLATGIKHFTLPADQNFITIYKKLSPQSETAADALIQIYLDRRQHEKSAALLLQTIENFPKSHSSKNRKKLLHQITGNWGQINTTSSASPAGKEPTLSFTYRNAKSVTLTVRPVDLDSMVNNLWKHLEGNPLKLNWRLTRWGSLGNTLVNTSRKKYVGKEIARRTHTLTPHDHHWDTRASLSIPVKKSGAYLVTALLENGVATHTVVWIDAAVIVKKNVLGGVLYYLADSTTGKAIPNTKIEFFGYHRVYRNKQKLLRKYDIFTSRMTRTTGADGTLIIKNSDLNQQHQWMTRAKTNHGVALLGFSRIRSHIHPQGTYNHRKAFAITDRPVYQPKQKVYGKFWIRNAHYDLKDNSAFAGKTFHITIRDASGTEVVKARALRADSYGGIQYTHDLPADAKLGSYSIQLHQDAKRNQRIGSHSFRVEKYKKPEYEVIVDAPKDPVKLGEKFHATIKANYYHGAPVTKATVKVKVLRHRHNDLWFPYGRWDWLYGSGYGWLDIERPWFPGWKNWGCLCPRPFWWHRGGEQPEIILEQELEIAPDGTLKIEIDTAIAKAVHSDTDHRYEVTAEVIDASRRTIVGKGSIIAARKAFKVTTWLDRGYAHIGDPINATIATRTADGKKVLTQGKTTLYRITSNDGKIEEKEIKSWEIKTTETNAQLKFQAGEAGQYRLSATMTDQKGRSIEGAILFTVRGKGKAHGGFQYSDIELIPDKRTYNNGSTLKLLINTNRPNSTIILSLRGGIEHRLIHLKGQSTVIDIPITRKDMPNFFIEAATVSNARVHTATREIIVPPEKRILNVTVLPNDTRYKPRAKGTIKVRITDQHGEPIQGSLALTIYDKSLEYISGGSNVTDIKTFFWKWRRHFSGGFPHSLSHRETSILKGRAEHMRTLGAFGNSIVETGGGGARTRSTLARAVRKMKGGRRSDSMAAPAAPMMMVETATKKHTPANNPNKAPAVMIRKDFADLIKWLGSVETDKNGIAEIPVTFPDNLTTWKIKTWAMAHGTRVGEGTAEVITSKDLIIRLQAPRFFVEKDQVTLSAIVHNYLKTEQTATISLELEGGTLTSTSPLTQKRTIPPGGETRIDWQTKATQEGTATIRMKVITPDDSDAMEKTFPVYVHGILKQQAWSHTLSSGSLQPPSKKFTITIPADRIPAQTQLEIRYSPTIAGSIIDAIPYLVDYPYGCTEQTLNRFVPTVIAQKLLREMNINLEDVRNKRTNLNPQEIGNDKARMAQWKRWQRNPVFSQKEVNTMTQKGITRLAEMQLTDGGWGWFSGYGEHPYPHTTAVVVHGLLIAKQNGANIPNDMLERGITWLKNHEARQTEHLRMWGKRKKHTKHFSSPTDALVRLTLAEAKKPNKEMLAYLFRDKNNHSVYVKSLTGMAHHLAGNLKNRDALIRNIEQFLIYDNENQSAHLNLGNSSYWWRWYGSEIETHAWYLKLLAATNPKSKQARGIVKHLINNRKHATYWHSTRDTAYCIEAIADYMRASGETTPNTQVTVIVDGKEIKTVTITQENLFSYDNKVTLSGDALGTGKHTIEIRRTGTAPLYTNTYLTLFTKEDFIKKAGLEVKVDRAYYKLVRIKDATEKTAGTRGQVIGHKIEKYTRIPLKSGDPLVSGDLVEVELHIHSKNDYEYLLFNDWKPAGLEAIKLRSGYTRAGGLRTYMQMHHEKTSFFLRHLPRGSHSLKYRLRAEIPGTFSALPTQASAMYAPELRANSDEIKIKVTDK